MCEGLQVERFELTKHVKQEGKISKLLQGQIRKVNTKMCTPQETRQYILYRQKVRNVIYIYIQLQDTFKIMTAFVI